MCVIIKSIKRHLQQLLIHNFDFILKGVYNHRSGNEQILNISIS
jgi:hypothetical protein